VAVNRLAVHQSVVHPVDPFALTELLAGTGWNSIGLHVAAAGDVEAWWSGGAGRRNLARLVELLLRNRVTVLDVGRIPLDRALPSRDVPEHHQRVLDLGARFGAQYVTARFQPRDPASPPGLAERIDLFGRMAEQARPYRLRPLLAPVPVDQPDALEEAVSVVAPSRGGLVLDVPVGAATAEQVEDAVVAAWEHVGYVRLSARRAEAAGEEAAGLLATLPPHVPVVLGGDDSFGALADDPAVRLRTLHGLVDRMLEHPLAREHRLRDPER
jgi:hypothetical protein